VGKSSILLLCGLLGLAACASMSTQEPEVLVVASDLDNRPFAFVDEAGRPGGRDVEMMERLAQELGARVEWRRMPFEQLLDAAERGEVDVVCATLGVTPERAQRVAFSQPYFETTQALLVRTGPGEPVWLSDLAGRRVGASADTTSGKAARERLTRSQLVFANKQELAPAERLLGGEVDALVLDRPAADAVAASSAGKLRVLSEQLAVERYALVLPLERIELRERLDAALASLGGELDQLDLRHGLVAAEPSRGE
jgi:polar amino acid transport system substrate-binding protein